MSRRDDTRPAAPGRRNKRVQVQQPTVTRTAYGQEQPGWSTVATLWGFVRSPDGREFLNATQQNATVSHVVEVNHPRSLVTVTPLMRLLVDGVRVFNITWAVDPDERKRTLQVGCLERVGPVETP